MLLWGIVKTWSYTSNFSEWMRENILSMEWH